MSNRLVVSVERSWGEGVSIKLLKAPANFDGAWDPEPFDCDPLQMPSWSQDHAVRAYGQAIFNHLQVHPAIRSAIESALHAPLGQVQALYFKIDVNDAERLLWETLCDEKGKFLALDRRWPIGRIADSPVDRPLIEYRFCPPLKILAFISALSVDGSPEWESLRQAVVQGRQHGLPIELLVYVGEQPLLDAIREEIRQGLGGVEVAPLPERISEIENAFRDFAPHLVHFFCHGSTAYGVGELELATILDRKQEKSAGSIRLSVKDNLAQMPGLDQSWLITFNCCEGGRPTSDLHSMAHSLVASGTPAAIGCLEPIAADDAHEFCQGFYPAIFDRLHTLLGGIKDGESVEFEWVDALRPPRTGLSQKHQNEPDNFRQWALPVIYVRPEAFRILKTGAGISPAAMKEMTERAELVAAALRSLPPDTPQETRDQVLALAADFPKELRPDHNGLFPGQGE